MVKTTQTAKNVCHNLRNMKHGFAATDILWAIIALSFIIRPSFVERENYVGERTTSLEWELPMAQFIEYIGDFDKVIARSWKGLDSDFGYRGNAVNPGRLMSATAKNGIVIMTAGFVDTNGRFTGNFVNNIDNYEVATQNMAVAFYDTAMEGMR